MTEQNEQSKPQAAAAKPAPAARPAAAPAAPAKPAENEIKPRVLAPAEARAELVRLKEKEGMDYLENLTGVDWGEEGLGVVYQLENTTTHQRVAIKTLTADRENPFLPSVSDLWDIANIYEREVYDFYGIKFTGHPDMRRIFMREDWVGYPFRKDDETEKNNPLRMTNEPLAKSVLIVQVYKTTTTETSLSWSTVPPLIHFTNSSTTTPSPMSSHLSNTVRVGTP